MTTSLTTAGATAARISRVLIVDDHPLVREGYREWINSQPDLEVCGEAGDAYEALRLLEAARPDVAIIDISLANGNGIELCKQIRARNSEIRLLVASAHEESLYADRSLRAGATGYLYKGQPAEKIIEAIRRVLRGQLFLSEHTVDRILARAIGNPQETAPSAIDSLSDRELQVFELIGQGVTTHQIAARLKLSPKTVESYRENLKKKLGLKNAAALTQHAIRWVLQEL